MLKIPTDVHFYVPTIYFYFYFIFKENKRILVLQDFRKIFVISFYVKYTPSIGRRATAEY